jgi:hypothetical protein
MNILAHALAAAAFVILPTISAFASQCPGTSAGTATALEQGLLIGAIVVAAGVGLIYRFRHR